MTMGSAELRAQSADRRWPRRYRALWLCSTLCALSIALPVLANPTQEEVFKSINENVGQTVDGTKVLAIMAAIAGLVIILVLFNRRQTREAAPTALNHQGKLLRELMKTAGLKPAEARQLKVLAEHAAAVGEPVESAVTLLLCPSVMKRVKQSS